MKTFAAIVLLLAWATPLWAVDWVGTWTSKSHPGITLTIESFGAGGARLTYHIQSDSKVTLMSLESLLNGSEAQVTIDGKPSGETMAIKRLDDRHTFTVIKMNGQPFGTSKGELSVDGKTLTSENDQPVPGGPNVKTTEIWERK
ncbi:MAG TPA: hypothetical protein VFX30_08805 [bacterium]|nr:hypothetical protein [bacterium]